MRLSTRRNIILKGISDFLCLRYAKIDLDSSMEREFIRTLRREFIPAQCVISSSMDAR